MNRLTFLTFLTLLALLAGVAPAVKADKQKPFKWTGRCTVRCDDGTCRLVCESGIVLASDIGDARAKAEAKLRASVAADGHKVIEGTISVSISFSPQASGKYLCTSSPPEWRYFGQIWIRKSDGQGAYCTHHGTVKARTSEEAHSKAVRDITRWAKRYGLTPYAPVIFWTKRQG